MRKFKWIAALMALFMVMAPMTALADAVEGEVVTLGNDLSPAQKEQVLQMLGVKDQMVETIVITIDEEKALLGSYIPAEQIGSRSLSSSYVKKTEAGSGITVKSQNITWVSDKMYASALATAGVTDAEIAVAAPVKVSGTAALAGILKAYEGIMDTTLSEQAKDTAAQELVTTGELAEIIGSEEAANFIATIKQEIIAQGLDTPEKLRPYVVDLAKQLEIQLTDEQIDQIVDLAMKFIQLDLDPQQIVDQLQGIAQKLDTLGSFGQKTKEFFSKIGESISGFFQWVGNLFK